MFSAPLVAASTTALVWLTIGLVSIIALAAMIIALVLHAIAIGRTASRFQEELAPITEEITALRSQASRAAGNLQSGRGARRS